MSCFQTMWLESYPTKCLQSVFSPFSPSVLSGAQQVCVVRGHFLQKITGFEIIDMCLFCTQRLVFCLQRYITRFYFTEVCD